jgi:hypothetical protein
MADLQEKPRIPLVSLDAIPEALRDVPHWVLWRYEVTKKGGFTKVPMQASGPTPRRPMPVPGRRSRKP